MIHFALIFPILMLVMVAILDLGRYFAVVAVLNAGAERGLNAALKTSNLDIDYRGLAESDVKYQRYRTARQMVVAEALEIPIGSRLVSTSSSPSDTTLVRMTVTDQGLGSAMTTPATPYQADAAFLRPGECTSVAGYGSVCNNQTVFTLPGAVSAWPPPSTMLKKHPVMIVLRAEVDAFLPFVDNYVAVGTALGFREEIPDGPLKGETPTPTPTPPAGSPTPTFSPGPGGTATPTPNPAACPWSAEATGNRCTFWTVFQASAAYPGDPVFVSLFGPNGSCGGTVALGDCSPGLTPWLEPVP